MAYPDRQPRRVRFKGLGLAFVALLSVCTALAHAQTYRWVDERGRVHYGDTLPPRAIDPAVLDKQGRMLRQLPQSQTGAAPAAAAGAHANETARERQDRALLSTYANEGEIDLARDRALAQEQARRASLQAMLQQTASRLSQLEVEAAAHAQAGRRVPDALSQARDETQREIVRLNELLLRNSEAMARTQARYEGYKRRFRELKGLAGPAPSNAGAVSASGNAVP